MFDIRKIATELHTINDFLRFFYTCANKADIYYGHGTDNSWDEVVALVLGILHLEHDINPSLLNAVLTNDEKKELLSAFSLRIEKNIPLPYILKEAFFCDLPFYVDQRVLIPRSPIAELIKNEFQGLIDIDNVHNILDLCTGSGCIGIACAYAFADAHVDVSDISTDARDVCMLNFEKHGLVDDINFYLSDCFDAIPQKKYDIIVSNPPYVSDAEIQTLPKEYHHEPKGALYAPRNGLQIVEKILIQAQNYLSDNGILVVEVGNSEVALCEEYPEIPFTWLEFANGGSGVFLLRGSDLKGINCIEDSAQ